MSVKLLSWIGMIACITLIISCFLPLTFYADPHITNEADRTFTSFYSYKDQYGKPGYSLVFLSALILLLMILPRVWAKRTNLFLGAFTLAYVIKTYILFTSCYNAYCPEKRTGIYIMLCSAIVILIACVFPNMKIVATKKENMSSR
jgi:hypothetical protein